MQVNGYTALQDGQPARQGKQAVLLYLVYPILQDKASQVAGPP